MNADLILALLSDLYGQLLDGQALIRELQAEVQKLREAADGRNSRVQGAQT